MIKKIILLFTVVISGCDKTNKIPSPDGNLILVTSINNSKEDITLYRCVKFEIQDLKGNILYKEQTRNANNMYWKMYWEGNDKVALTTGSLYTVFWQRKSSGKWEKFVSNLIFSPDKKLVLHYFLKAGSNKIHFSIGVPYRMEQGEVSAMDILYRVKTNIFKNEEINAEWISSDKIKIGGDRAGDFYWQRQKSGKWKQL